MVPGEKKGRCISSDDDLVQLLLCLGLGRGSEDIIILS
ncbi:hypothetical protein TIFTF001_038524 [Ficus carica]|uniref:Uncharacterized protein n=1 Tax=Ficus carica TaxID=3494 RepID=A0AA88JDX1_FICCA|nr:hypothetical protein TIFTF001_038524 [Ficus carica]